MELKTTKISQLFAEKNLDKNMYHLALEELEKGLCYFLAEVPQPKESSIISNIHDYRERAVVASEEKLRTLQDHPEYAIPEVVGSNFTRLYNFLAIYNWGYPTEFTFTGRYNIDIRCALLHLPKNLNEVKSYAKKMTDKGIQINARQLTGQVIYNTSSNHVAIEKFWTELGAKHIRIFSEGTYSLAARKPMVLTVG